MSSPFTNDQAVEAIQQMNDAISNKESIYLTFTSNASSFTTRFNTPKKLNPNRKYECALQYFSTSNYQINITEKNNKFTYTHNGADDPKIPSTVFTWTTITLEKGAYEIKHINDEIQRLMIEKGHYDKTKDGNGVAISMGLNLSTFKSYIDITDNRYKVDFTRSKSLRNLLGFESKILSKGHNISDNTVQITTASSIMINCDLISGSYHNGIEKNILYSFPAYIVPTGYKINIIPSVLMYLPVNRSVINSITFTITDDNFEVLDFKNERMSMGLHIRQV